jgi:glutathione S-transferase
VPIAARGNRVSDTSTRRDLARLPQLLDHVDELISEGVLGGPEPNAADFQIAPSIRELWTLEDVRPQVEGRPANELAVRYASRMNGHVPPVFPVEWLA